jgi:hypothetical protein
MNKFTPIGNTTNNDVWQLQELEEKSSRNCSSASQILEEESSRDCSPASQITVFWENHSVKEKVQFISALEMVHQGKIPTGIQELTEPHRLAILKALIPQFSLIDVINCLPNYALEEESGFEALLCLIKNTVNLQLSAVAEKVGIFELSEPHRLEVFKQITERRHPSIVFEEVCHYHLSVPFYLEAVRFAAPFTNEEHIRNEINELKGIGNRSEKIAEKNLYNMLNCKHPAETHFEVAKILAAYNGKGVLINIDQFRLTADQKREVQKTAGR